MTKKSERRKGVFGLRVAKALNPIMMERHSIRQAWRLEQEAECSYLQIQTGSRENKLEMVQGFKAVVLNLWVMIFLGYHIRYAY